jgi:hypothetical protein
MPPPAPFDPVLMITAAKSNNHPALGIDHLPQFNL